MSLRYSAVAISVAVLAVACGTSTGGSGFADAQDEQVSSDEGDNSGSTTAGGFGGGGSGGDTKPNPTALNECATAAAAATLKPANLVVIYDRSGSMGQDTKGRNVLSKKWTPVGDAMKGFFSDAASKGLSASLAFFPKPGASTVDSICTPTAYSKPQVDLEPLPSADFGKAIDGTSPGGGTPTTDAIKGAINYAQGIAKQKSGEKVVVALVTDGLPGVYNFFGEVCTPNTVSTAADQASSAFKGTPSIPTYVIGVADTESTANLKNLDDIAKAGGTTSATIVDTSDPTKTKADFKAALDKIRGDALSCDFDVPPPPNGQTIDFNAVNVTLTKDAKADLLSYSKDCSDNQGWHYDDPATPTKIILCDSACGAAKDAQKIDIVFGCATQGGSGPR